MGIQVPERYSGAALSSIEYCICIEELARVDPALALSVAAHNGLCSAHLLMFGSEAQKQTYLVPLARGEKIGAWGLTESTSGSDAAGMGTAAARRDGGWVISGSKRVHDARSCRRRHGRHGRDRQGEKDQGHLGLRRPEGDRRA